MAKEVKKKFKLPAQGKPKPKPKKTSARALGKVANEQFKAGSKDYKKKNVDSPFFFLQEKKLQKKLLFEMKDQEKLALQIEA